MSSSLPIYDCLPALKDALTSHNEAVLEAPPGAGKTSVVPIELLSEPWLAGQKILLLEPRRIAAKLAAQRLAESLHEPLGETVGYRIRLESKVSINTRIEVITEGILTRLLQNDPSLDGIGLIIFDEFHERSLDADLGLALSIYGRELFRESLPLKLLIMSATLDGNAIAKIIGSEDKPAPIISSEGRQFPIRYHYAEKRPDIGFSLEQAVAETVEIALQKHMESILVFLPGQGEIRRVIEKISTFIHHHPDTILTPLYGNLSLPQQQEAIRPPPEGKRKIVLATAIAETSVTIQGVSIVIDSGLSRLPKYDTRTGLTRLYTQRVSQASSIQRAGRAGRTAPGICYRLWPEYQQGQLVPQTPPEIEQADLTNLTLQLFKWGVQSDELRWLTRPPAAAMQHATELLISLAALETNHNKSQQLTSHGTAIAALPMHPRFAHMLLTANTHQQQQVACLLAAMLPERDLIPSIGSDINARLDKLIDILNRKLKPSTSENHIVRIIQQQALRYFSLLPQQCNAKKKFTPLPNLKHNEGLSGRLIAYAYPDRIAKQRPNQTSYYVLANGREAYLPAHDPLTKNQWLAIANSGGQQGHSNDRIYLASPLQLEEFDTTLANQTHTTSKTHWSNEGKLVAEEQLCIGKLIIRSKALKSLTQEQKTLALIQWIKKQGLQCLPWTNDIKQWQARVLLLRESDTNNNLCWPDISEAHLSTTIEEWLAPYLNNITHIKQLNNIDMFSILKNLLPWPLPNKLNELAPNSITVPSGSNHRIDYSQTPPVLAVKLQEMFGCNTTPSINNGKIALTIHLLSPARRPLQVTQDLDSFWSNGYDDVKKEMKGRYPKHPWPDDPRAAIATAKTKRHLS
ncbi:ATP-dependent helicase HrpB [Gammaproteobacteria bacterium 42_54_T18]|nr:ATP-dependent helicase HrpB [Gammaproteobacteria bacterium 42_54_T18]